MRGGNEPLNRTGEHLAHADSTGMALFDQIAEDLKPWADSGITLDMVSFLME